MSYGVVLPPGIVRIPSPSGGAASFATLTGVPADNAALTTALNLKLDKTGGTLTGQLVNSTNGALSTPSTLISGSIISGGTATTTKPLFQITPAGTTDTGWSTGGTGFGVNVSAITSLTNSASIASTKMIADFQEVGVRQMSVTKMTFGGISNAPTLLGGGGNYPVSLSLVGSNGLAYFRRIDDGWLMGTGSGFLAVPSGARIGFSDQATGSNVPTGTGSVDAFHMRGGAAHIKQGATHATTPTNQRYSAHNTTTGIGASLTKAGGNGGLCPGSEIVIGGGDGNTGTGDSVVIRVSDSFALRDVFKFNSQAAEVLEGYNFSFGSTTGSVLGTSTSDKIGFWGSAGVIQGSSISDVSSPGSLIGGDSVDMSNLQTSIIDLQSAVNSILNRLRTPGWIAT